MTFSVDVNLAPALAAIKGGTADGLRAAVEHLLSEANKHVPHRDGDLEQSGEATTDGKRRGAVSYDTPYAVRQHEDMTLSHDGKGKAKWLETTMTREADTVAEIAAGAIRSKLGG